MPYVYIPQQWGYKWDPVKKERVSCWPDMGERAWWKFRDPDTDEYMELLRPADFDIASDNAYKEEVVFGMLVQDYGLEKAKKIFPSYPTPKVYTQAEYQAMQQSKTKVTTSEIEATGGKEI